MLRPVFILLAAALGLLAGAALVRFWAQGKIHAAQTAQAKAEVRIEEKEESIRLQRQTAEDLKREIDNSFRALAGAALQVNTEHLLTTAETKFKPFEKQLEDLRNAANAMEQKRAGAYGALEQQLNELRSSTGELKTQSERLATALRGSSQARGRWGESTLKRLVEMAGMQEHCDFDEQGVTGAGQRPDLVVKLPGKGAIPIDAKVPLAAYLDAAAAPDEESRRIHLTKHAADLKSHIRDLARKDYAHDLGGQVDFTVLFVPGEPFLAAAFSEDPDLFEAALEQRVLIASPVTLMALLRTVRLNWDHIAVERNALEIRDAALRLFESTRVFAEHFEKLGAGLGKSVESYAAALRSYESRVLPRARRLTELRIGSADAFPEPGEIAAVPSFPPAPEKEAGA